MPCWNPGSKKDVFRALLDVEFAVAFFFPDVSKSKARPAPDVDKFDDGRRVWIGAAGVAHHVAATVDGVDDGGGTAGVAGAASP